MSLVIGPAKSPTLRIKTPQPAKAPGQIQPGGVLQRVAPKPPAPKPVAPKLPPPPSGGGHYVTVGGNPQLIHAIGRNQWAPGPPNVKPVNFATDTFGLNTQSKAPFNPLAAGPTTQGAFNQQVLNLAQPQYLPQLQDIQGQQAAENVATGQRTGDINSIYNQYAQQAQTAYNEAQRSLQDIIAQNAPAAGQANLSAALQSAQGGQNQLAQMMGMTAPPGPGTLPYMGAAGGAAAATQDQLNSLASSFLNVPAAQLANVPGEAATELNTESLRHQAAAQGLRTQQSALAEQVPGIIEKAREQLLSDLQSGQSLRFQEQLAGKQFGLQTQAQTFNETQTRNQFRETQINDAANRANARAQLAQNAQTLANSTNATNVAANQAIAKAQGQAQANAIKQVQGWLTPTKQELTSKTIKDPNTGATSRITVIDPNKWHKDVGTELRSIMGLYNLNLGQALGILEDVGGSAFLNGNGGQTIAQWAYTFRTRQTQRALASKRNAAINKALAQGVQLANARTGPQLSKTPPVRLPR